MQEAANGSGALVASYLTLRKAIGILGTALPFILSLGALFLFDTGIQDSISAYYHTDMGNVFVGSLCTIGAFLYSYKGYERKDDLAGDLACIFAVGVALFPTDLEGEPTTIAGVLHLTFAALFFLTLAYFALHLFTKTDSSQPPTPMKLRRNQVYRVCGYAMLAAIALIALYKLLPSGAKQVLSSYDPVFWLESIAVVAFGISWLIKGEALLGDQVGAPRKR